MKRVIGMVFLYLGIFVASTFGAERYAIFPQFASGIGWSSTLFFANQGVAEVSDIVVSFYKNNGDPLQVQSNLGTASSYTFSLALGATQRIQVVPSGSFQEGYVVVKYPWTGDPVRATEIFRYENNGTVEVEVGVPQQEQGDHFSFPVEINSAEGILTAVVLANPADFNPGNLITQTLVLNLIDTNGNINSTATVTLGPGEQGTYYLNQIFSGLGDFIGTLSVSSPMSAGVLAMRQDKQAFGGISTDGGPILGPFLASGNIYYEAEPNDSPTEGDIINFPRPSSTIFAGTIGFDGDEDYYQFEGNAGDIISIICWRDESVNYNYLDPVLAVYRWMTDHYELVGFNDQNGLAPQLYPMNDSFIQMRLPADDVYYIGVYDYWDYGDSNSAYWLDVKLP